MMTLTKPMLALSVLGLVATLCLTPGAGLAEGHGGTSVHLYSPFSGGSPAAGIRIGKTARGYCWTSSLADSREDAFRCFVGNVIFDPCFSDDNGLADFVLCPLFSPASRVFRINLTKKLPAGNPPTADPTRYDPWAVQTTSGRWCTILTGATGRVAGLRINYRCAGGGILLGSPRRKTSTWTIFYAPGARSGQFRAIGLRSAWW
jgi:hypothetical protein